MSKRGPEFTTFKETEIVDTTIDSTKVDLLSVKTEVETQAYTKAKNKERALTSPEEISKITEVKFDSVEKSTFFLPSEARLQFTDGITNDITINDLFWNNGEKPKVIMMQTSEGKITKARRNGKSYIALGGERKGLRPIINNGDRFINISSSHEIISNPSQPLQLLNKKIYYCFLHATKGYTVNDLVANNQGVIEINYANTIKNRGTRYAKRDSNKGVYIDTTTGERALVYDGVQIRLTDKEILTKEEDIGEAQIEDIPNIGEAEKIDNDLSKEKVSGSEIESPYQRKDFYIKGPGNEGVMRNAFCYGLHKVESGNHRTYGYSAFNPATNALGRYQFVRSIHKKNIQKVTHAKTMQAFLESPKAQETYMDYHIKELQNFASEARRKYTMAKKYTYAQLLAICHFQGTGGAAFYLKHGVVKGGHRKNNMDIKKYLTAVQNGIRSYSSSEIARTA